MIVCSHSKVIEADGGWRVDLDDKIVGLLNLFKGQTLFGARPDGYTGLSLSTIRLNPMVSYFRVFMEDIRGSLAGVTELFSSKGINILSSGAFSLGNIWVSEYIADFKDMDATPEVVANDIEGMGGFVTSREITEFFPRAFELESTYDIKADERGGLYILLGEAPQGVAAGSESYAVLKGWAEVQALFVDFLPQGTKLVRIATKLSDVPGSLNKLASLLGTQVNMHAVDAQHHDEASGVWNIYGVLEIGSVEELVAKAEKAPTIQTFEVEPLGWRT